MGTADWACKPDQCTNLALQLPAQERGSGTTEAPGQLGGATDPDARPGRNLRLACGLEDLEGHLIQRQFVMDSGHTEGLAQAPWARTKKVRIIKASAHPHNPEAVGWLDGPYQNGASRQADKVQAPVDPV